jgi:N utilization substance protein B
VSRVTAHARRAARERAVQCLFGLDFSGNEVDEALAMFWEATPARDSVRAYAEELVRGVMDNLAVIDAAIATALENWSPERVGRIERNAIRVALYEMRHIDDVPDGVAINEAIEVARRFGSDEAPRFVNAVLDRLKKDPA